MALITYRHACNGCGVTVGTTHREGCDVARCTVHGNQFHWCEDEACTPNVWTGYWAGELEAIEYGFFTYWATDGTGWQPCGPEHPQAMPDLNRIMVECEWDAVTQRFTRRS